MSNLQKYVPYDLETAKEEQEHFDQAGDFLKLPQGKTKIRILPPPIDWGIRSPFVRAYQHYIPSPEDPSKKVSFNCPRIMASRPCPACAQADRLRATGNPADRELAKDFSARPRYYVNVIDRGSSDKGPVILAASKTVYEALVKIRSDEDAGGDYTNPGEEGFDIVITKTGEQLKTEYQVNAARDNSPLGNMDWLEMQKNPAQFARVPTEAELKDMLGLDDEPPQQARSGNAGGTSGRGRRGRNAMDDSIDTEGTEVK